MPWLYLKGISSGEMGEGLKILIGPEAKGLLASTVSRLKQIWGQEYQSWCDEPLGIKTVGSTCGLMASIAG